MTKIIYTFFMLIIFFIPVFSHDTDDETQAFVFGDIFKSIPTLFEYLLQMVEERPEVLETNNIDLMKREIGMNSCDNCDHAKREIKMHLKCPIIPISHDTNKKESGGYLQIINRVSDRVYREVSSGYGTENGNRNRVVQAHSKLDHVSDNLKMREPEIFLDDKVKRDSYYEICSKPSYNIENQRSVNVKDVNKCSHSKNAARSIDGTEFSKTIKNIDEIALDNVNEVGNKNKLINRNKIGVQNKRQVRYKKFAGDLNTLGTFLLTPEEVEEHIFKVDQMLEERKRNQTK